MWRITRPFRTSAETAGRQGAAFRDRFAAMRSRKPRRHKRRRASPPQDRAAPGTCPARSPPACRRRSNSFLGAADLEEPRAPARSGPYLKPLQRSEIRREAAGCCRPLYRSAGPRHRPQLWRGAAGGAFGFPPTVGWASPQAAFRPNPRQACRRMRSITPTATP